MDEEYSSDKGERAWQQEEVFCRRKLRDSHCSCVKCKVPPLGSSPAHCRSSCVPSAIKLCSIHPMSECMSVYLCVSVCVKLCESTCLLYTVATPTSPPWITRAGLQQGYLFLLPASLWGYRHTTSGGWGPKPKNSCSHFTHGAISSAPLLSSPSVQLHVPKTRAGLLRSSHCRI